MCSCLGRSNVSDIADLDFFADPGYHFVFESIDSNGDIYGRPGCCINPARHNFSGAIGSLAQHNLAPNIWIEVDSFAKSFYTTIMADLGQVSNDSILQNDTLLQHFTSNITSMIGPREQNGVETYWLLAGPARQSYNELKDATGHLNVSASVIYAQYFCQVPELKSGGSLFIAILVADLVFLQALWKVLNWSTIAWLERTDPHANFCPGCLKASDRGFELSPRDSTTAIQSLPVPTDKARPTFLGRKGGYASSESHQQLISPSADMG